MGVCGSSDKIKSGEHQIIANKELVLESKKQLQKRWSSLTRDPLEIKLESDWSSSCSNENISSVYETIGLIGEGFTSKVVKARLRGYPKKMFAIKSIKKSFYSNSNSKYFEEEVNILKELDHPNIVRFFECYQDTTHYHLVLELCEGRSLVKPVEATKGLSEEMAKRLFFQAAYAVNYLHQVGATHRDIKLDNFLFSKADNHDIGNLKLIDFGFSKNFRSHALSSHVGTSWYIAPEILSRQSSYTYACDNWSLGVMLYLMLFAEPPFKGHNNEEIFKKIREREIDFLHRKFSGISQEAVIILNGLLCKNPASRLTLPEVLQSSWFHPVVLEIHQGFGPDLARHVISKLKACKARSKFKREVYKTMVKIFSDNREIKEKVTMFYCCDYLNNGIITQLELEHLFKDAGLKPAPGEIKSMVDTLFLKTEDVITYSEFLAGMVNKDFFVDRLRLKLAFDRFDVDHSGVITEDNIARCYNRFGYQLGCEPIKEMIADFDIEKNGVISFDEFSKKMSKD
jgi:calcium-dependent protein kinase